MSKLLDYFGGDDLAASVWKDKYAAPGEETPDYMHRRMAKEFARVRRGKDMQRTESEWADYFFDLFKDFKKIIPQGRVMAGVGRNETYRSLSNCFRSGTKVLTSDGVKRIEDVEIGDMTVSHDGSHNKVVQTHRNRLDGRQVYSLKVYGSPTVEVTDNHRFWSLTEEQLAWGESVQENSVDKLRVGDYIAIPRRDDATTTFPDKILLKDILKPSEKIGDYIYTYKEYEHELLGVTNYMRHGKEVTMSHNNKVKKEWELDDHFSYFVGLWYGDGCVFSSKSGRSGQRSKKYDKTMESNTPKGITFTFSSEEAYLIEFVSSYGEKLTGVVPVITYNGDDHSCQIVFHSILLGVVFEKLFGRWSYGKSVADVFFNAPIREVESLLQGLIDSDGTITKNGDVRVVLANVSLIREVYLVARSHGIIVAYSEVSGGNAARLSFPKYSSYIKNSNKRYTDNRKDFGRPKYSPMFVLEKGGVTLLRIQGKNKIECSDEYVYTLGIDDVHSYSVEGLMSMNCTVLPSPKDSYSSILYTDAMLVAAAKRGCGYGLDLSNLRPQGTLVKNAAGSSTGMASFMERYSNSTREVAQAGRRGACLLSIDVRHPDVDKFIQAKEDRTKVTGANISVKLTDDFMRAVEEDKDFLQCWPCDSELYASDYALMAEESYGQLTELYGNPWKMAKRVKARELYDLIISHAHADAEPGVFFWDRVLDFDPSSVYEEFKPICTNACFTGDTLIAVADGRNAVTIKELADKGEDVTVYSVDPKTGKVSIQVGRHPRITGYNQPLVRVTLDDGSYLDVTPTHEFCLLDGTRVEARNLNKGMSLPRFTKRLSKITPEGKNYFRINCNTLNSNVDKIFEHRLIAKFYDPEKWDKVESTGTQGGFVNTNGVVVHHIDDDGLNNSIDNLEILTVSEHQTRHAKGMSTGENNGRYCGVDNNALREIGIEYAKRLGRRFSTDEWEEFAKEKGLPTKFSNYRGSTVRQFAEVCAVDAGLDYVDAHPFTLKVYRSALEMGYNARIVGSEAQVEKVCEGCGEPFWVPFCKREQGYCTASCYPLNTDPDVERRRRASRNAFLSTKQEETKTAQAKIYSSLKFELDRPPMQKEWEAECKAQGVPRRIGKTLKFAYKNFKEVAAAGDAYNHKVVSVEPLDGLHTVYNITVDKNHTVGIVTKGQQNAKEGSFDGIFTFQCGEEPMSFGDTCRLLVINLLSIVKDPYTSKAAIDWDALKSHAIEAVMLGDDLVDLEIEYAKRILAKVKSDPEPEDEKLPEIRLWERIIYTAEQGRRTGCGITGLGDMLAALGLKYDSPEALEIVEAVMHDKQYYELATGVAMAKKYGAFPAWDNALEYPDGVPANSFYSHLQEKYPSLVEAMQEYGRRAMNWSTIAPTGSTSILAKGPISCNISAGCEPQFFLFYTRKRKINPSEVGSRIDFTDQNGDHWMEYPVLMGGFKDWITTSTDITEPELLSKEALQELYEKSPWHNATANDIDWEARVKMQAILQKYTTAAISTTLNLPNDVSIDKVSDIYLQSWKLGNKGQTIYREGSRTGVLVKDSTPAFTQHSAPKRPKSLPADLYHVTAMGKKWTVCVGLMEDKPYEVFASNADFGKHKSRVSVVKKRKRVYSVLSESEEILIHNVADTNTGEEAALAKMCSAALRHGMGVDYAVKTLEENEGAMVSFSKAIARTLAKYTTTIEGDKCPECGNDSLRREEGCVKCLQCSYSKC